MGCSSFLHLSNSRRESLSSYRKSSNKSLPNFFFDKSKKNNNNKKKGSNFKFYFRKYINSEKDYVFIMNKISIIGLIFGLLLIASLLFVVGFISAFVLMPSSEGNTKVESSVQEEASSPGFVQSIAASIGGMVDRLFKGADKIEKVAPYNIVPSDSHQGRFTVQLNGFSDEAVAMESAIKYKSKGITGVYITKVKDVKGIEKYYVKIGSFGDYIAAENYSRKLQTLGEFSAKVSIIHKGEDRRKP